MSRGPFLRLVSSVAILAHLVGCASSEVSLQSRSTKERAESLNEVAARPMAPADVSPVKVRSDIYVGADVFRNDHGKPLPGKWDRESVTFAKAQLVTFQEIANYIFQVTKIPVAVVSEHTARNTTQSSSDSTSSNRTSTGPVRQTTAPKIAAGPVPEGFDMEAAKAALLSGTPSSNSGNSDGEVIPNIPKSVTGTLGITGTMRVNYTGKLSEFLDLVGTNFNVNWEYNGSQIVFSKTLMKTFEIPTLPIISKMGFTMTSGSDAGGTGGQSGATGSSNQKASTEAVYQITKDIQSSLESIVVDGSFRYNQATGQVTVIASPQTIRRVSEYIRGLNAQLSKQIALNVKVYAVTLTDTDDYSSSIDGIFNQMGSSSNVLTYGNVNGSTSPATLGSAASASTGNIGWAILKGNMGVNGIVQALSSRGDVSVVTSASVVAINNVPVPLQVANTRGYAAKVTVTQSTSSSGSPTTSIDPGSVTTGFNLHLLPKVRPDGSLLLQYGINISDLVGSSNGFDVFCSNGTVNSTSACSGSSIQLPNINQRNFIQEAILPNGSTLVLAGFEQVKTSASKSGPVNSNFFFLGGSNKSNLNREILVIAITPTLLDASASANPPSHTW